MVSNSENAGLFAQETNNIRVQMYSKAEALVIGKMECSGMAQMMSKNMKRNQEAHFHDDYVIKHKRLRGEQPVKGENPS